MYERVYKFGVEGVEMRFSRGKIRVRGSFPIFIWRTEYREMLGKKLNVVIGRNTIRIEMVKPNTAFDLKHMNRL